MGERIFRVFLNELTTIRVTCKDCSRTVECAIADVASQFKNGNCPFCNAGVVLGHGNGSGDLGDLVLAIRHLQERAPKLTVEFPISLPD